MDRILHYSALSVLFFAIAMMSGLAFASDEAEDCESECEIKLRSCEVSCPPTSDRCIEQCFETYETCADQC